MSAPPFPDRAAAGRELASELGDLADHRPIVFGLPRCGVPVAYEVARHLRAPLDVALVRIVRAPGDRSRLVATILEGHTPEVLIERDWEQAPGASREWLEAEVSAALAEIEDRRRRYRGTGGMISPSGRLAIVVDQSIGPGYAMAGAIRLLRAAGASKVVIATPVASRSGVQRFEGLAARMVCLRQESELAPIEHYYGDAAQVSHEEALAWLAQPTDPDE